jgi:hypothetical protein
MTPQERSSITRAVRERSKLQSRGRRRGLLVGVSGGAIVAACVLVATAVTMSGVGGKSKPVQVPVQADTYVSAQYPTRAYGTASSLYLSSAPSDRRSAYVQFVVPAGGIVTRAKLVLTRDDHPFPATSVTVSSAASDWPAQITFGNRPASGNAIATAHVDPGMKTVSLDITSAVTGAGVYAFMLSTPEATGSVSFRSREFGKDAPYLTLKMTDASGVALPVPSVLTPSIPASVGGVRATTPPAVSASAKAKAGLVKNPAAHGKGNAGGVAKAAAGCSVSSHLVPSCGVWFGAIPPAQSGAAPAQALSDFEQRLGQPVDIVHTYHVGSSPFPDDLERSWANDPVHPRELLINWKPEFGHTWAQVASGAADQQIDKSAAYITSNFRSRFFLSIHHEPEDEVKAAANSGYTATDYRNMFRHVALRLRADGVDNAVLVMNYMGFADWGVEPWFDQLYPGDDVVDWIAFDPYATAASSGYTSGTFADMVNRGKSSSWPGMYNWVTGNHPGKPIMLAEWGVADGGSPDLKAQFFNEIPSYLPKFPALKALVYYDSPKTHLGDTRTNSTSQSQEAFNALADQKTFTASVVK